MTASFELAAFAAGIRVQDLPEDVVHAVRRHLLDAIGCALASATTGAGAPVVEAVRGWAGAREAGVLGYDFRAPAPQAALATGTLIHAMAYDDTHVASVVHTSSAVVPAALAAGEEAGADGRTVLAALAAGYEVAGRIGIAAGGVLHGRGLDPTGFCGVFGAAAAASRAWGLSDEQTFHALGLAGAMAGGLLADRAGGSDVMRIRGGWAAQNGVIAADLARRGLTGPAGIVEGMHGLFSPGLAVEALGEQWETARIAIKPYPASHFVHAFADAAARISVKPGDVDEIVCVVAPQIVPIVCEPRAAKIAPASDVEARFSLHYAVAAALHGGRAPLEMFGDDARTDRRVLSLAERVTYEAASGGDFPRAYGGSLRVHLKDGRVRSADEPINRGHPDRPLTDDEVRAKFAANVRRRLESGAAAKLAGEVWRLHELDDIDELVALASVQ